MLTDEVRRTGQLNYRLQTQRKHSINSLLRYNFLNTMPYITIALKSGSKNTLGQLSFTFSAWLHQVSNIKHTSRQVSQSDPYSSHMIHISPIRELTSIAIISYLQLWALLGSESVF